MKYLIYLIYIIGSIIMVMAIFFKPYDPKGLIMEERIITAEYNAKIKQVSIECSNIVKEDMYMSKKIDEVLIHIDTADLSNSKLDSLNMYIESLNVYVDKSYKIINNRINKIVENYMILNICLENKRNVNNLYCYGFLTLGLFLMFYTNNI